MVGKCSLSRLDPESRPLAKVAMEHQIIRLVAQSGTRGMSLNVRYPLTTVTFYLLILDHLITLSLGFAQLFRILREENSGSIPLAI